jgi:hypothetical protein
MMTLIDVKMQPHETVPRRLSSHKKSIVADCSRERWDAIGARTLQERYPEDPDLDRLQQVVWNLLANAVKFTSRGRPVQIRLERINSHVEIVVSDIGVGIAPEFLPYVFERFRQGENHFGRTHSGLGLGLRLHGSTAGPYKPPGHEGPGQMFRVAPPLWIADQPYDDNPSRVHPRAERYPTDVASGPSLVGITILVVDDDEDAFEPAARDTRSARGDRHHGLIRTHGIEEPRWTGIGRSHLRYRHARNGRFGLHQSAPTANRRGRSNRCRRTDGVRAVGRQNRRAEQRVSLASGETDPAVGTGGDHWQAHETAQRVAKEEIRSRLACFPQR